MAAAEAAKVAKHEVQVHVQYSGKGDFSEVDLIFDPVAKTLTFKDSAKLKSTRTANVKGCKVSIPKSERKGYEIALRLDLKEGEKDNTGENKFIIALQTKKELSRGIDDLYPAPDEQTVCTHAIPTAA